MGEMIAAVWDGLMNTLRQEWFWAMLAVPVSMLIFAVQSRKENEISRANFVYNISNDFANNDRILRVYQWLEKCRRQNHHVKNYRHLHISTDDGIYDEDRETQHLDFVDIDTYINHFEVVYVILNSVKIDSIDELFQQRFLSFMFNPFIQKEELFACFGPDKNDFLLMQKWLRSIQRRNRFTNEAFVDYLNTYTCGSFEFSKTHLQLAQQKKSLLNQWRIRDYLNRYVWYVCDPACRYGFYAFTRQDQRKVLRIIRPEVSDQEDILQLQNRVLEQLEQPAWFSPSSPEEIGAIFSSPKDYAAVQICDGSRIVAFAYAIRNPRPQQDVNVDLQALGLPHELQQQCILDTVFVDPQYRGFGMQQVLVDILCQWMAMEGKKHITATIHPDNAYSRKNFLDNGFACVTQMPIPKYGSQRHVYSRKLSRKDIRKKSSPSYTVYPYA